MGPAIPAPVRLGDVLMGRYRIDGMLGQGGMGQVFVAEHLKIGSRVAIKVLHPKLAARPDVVKRFEREARATGRIASPHVAKVVDVDAAPGGTPFMVMELLEGLDVAEYLLRHGTPPIGIAARWLRQAAEGAAAAHAAGIIHRDFKPANLFIAIDADGASTIKVLDFGISRSAEAGEETLTHGGIVGSPAYMAPEQLAGATVDARADVYALGVTLYEVLSGRLPLEGRRVGSQERPTGLQQLRSDVPDALARIVEQCMAVSADERLPSARALSLALDPFVTDERPEVVIAAARAGAGAQPEVALTEPANGPAPRAIATADVERRTESIVSPTRGLSEPTPTPPLVMMPVPLPKPRRRVVVVATAVVAVAVATGLWLARVRETAPLGNATAATEVASTARLHEGDGIHVTPESASAVTAPPRGATASASVRPSSSASVRVAPSVRSGKSATSAVTSVVPGAGLPLK